MAIAEVLFCTAGAPKKVSSGTDRIWGCEDVFTEVAENLIFSSDYNKAEYFLKHALKECAKDSKIYSKLGVLYAETGRVDEAEDAFEKALELDPENPEALYSLGIAYNNPGRIKQAGLIYKNLLAKEKKPEKRARLFNELGKCSLYLNSFQDAFEAFSSAHNDNHSLPSLHTNLGVLYIGAGSLVLDAGTLSPDVLMFINKLIAFANNGAVFSKKVPYANDRSSPEEIKAALYATGEAFLLEEARLNPLYSFSYHNLGLFYLNNKDYARAEKNFRRSIELNPRSAMGYFNLGMTLLQKAKIGDYKAAESCFDRAFFLGYDNGYHFLFLGELYLAAGNKENAARWLAVARQIFEDAGLGEEFNSKYEALMLKFPHVDGQ